MFYRKRIKYNRDEITIERRIKITILVLDLRLTLVIQEFQRTRNHNIMKVVFKSGTLAEGRVCLQSQETCRRA